MSSDKPPKLLEGNEFLQWKREVEIWQLATTLTPARQAPRAILSIVDQKARDFATRLSKERLSGTGQNDGLTYLLAELGKFFSKDRVQTVFIAIEKLETFVRPKEMSILDFVKEFGRRVDAVTELISTENEEKRPYDDVFSNLLEPFGKILLCIGGMISECYSANWMLIFHSEELMVHSSSADWQHFTMYLAFMLTGIIDILCVKYGSYGRTISHMSYILAYTVEASLFYSHFQGRPALDSECHKLIAYSGFAIAATLAYCLFNPNSIIASCLYSLLVCLHGLWFIEVAFLILSPFPNSTWEIDSHVHALLADVFFWWTFMGIGLVMILIAIVGDKMRKKGRLPGHTTNVESLEMNGLLDSDEE